ncbi:MBL fold metallo-hydrolase [Agromyces protaetiae]|uniref:MBL fold metallo-hydrolase n=1 Tax=Agromyces protaetiae TaxID=2509455 RepID=A0A4P6FF04_9MICO|nr:MBL fold metallo-hydrolase [Agromyces protaetiae]QAY72969.1 MBL fold metallo-hydrolase [Agromyces protaetiae]
MADRPILTHIGGPTLLIELAGWRLLVDPTFDPPGRKYSFGWGTSSVKTAGPNLPLAELGAIDVVLLSHDQHADNLDDAGKAMLPSAGEVITTFPGGKRLRAFAGLEHVVGLRPWETAEIAPEGGKTGEEHLGRPPLTVTATPARHGPKFSRPIAGAAIGFAISVGDAPETSVWVTGDTVMYDGLRDAASRLDVDVAVVHIGAVRFPITGGLKFTMDASGAAELVGLLRPRRVVPVHCDQWSHFREPREAAERVLDASGPDVRDRVTWLDGGVSAEV